MRIRGLVRGGMRTVVFLLAAPVMALAQPAPEDVNLTVITNGLSSPIGVTHAPGDDARLFVNQQGSTAQGAALRVVRDGALLGSPMLTVTGATTCKPSPGAAAVTVGFTGGGERGLLGVAFHPSFESNGQLFLSFTDANGDSMIVRYTMADPSADVLSADDRATCLVILRVDQDFTNHNGGNILFGPDGYLYFGLGDGGSGNDPCNRAQTLNPASLLEGNQSGVNCDVDAAFVNSGGNGNSRALLGKLLRLDVDGSTAPGANTLCASAGDGSANYAIPATNPFIGGDPQSACDEVWAYGLRNPWRWSFDRDTDDLIIGDVGQDKWEEVSLIPAGTPFGQNLGWKLCEGRHVRGDCIMACAVAGSVVPIIEYNNSGNMCMVSPTPNGCSVTGGFRYRGPEQALQGVYFYGDACNSELRWSVEQAGTWVQPSAAVIKTPLAGPILGFGEDEVGALYAVSGNTLYRIGEAGPPNGIFEDGFEDPEP